MGDGPTVPHCVTCVWEQPAGSCCRFIWDADGTAIPTSLPYYFRKPNSIVGKTLKNYRNRDTLRPQLVDAKPLAIMCTCIWYRCSHVL